MVCLLYNKAAPIMLIILPIIPSRNSFGVNYVPIY